MNPHSSHRIVGTKIVNTEIRYCDYCSIFATHPEIEQPCRRRPNLLEELKRLETLHNRLQQLQTGYGQKQG